MDYCEMNDADVYNARRGWRGGLFLHTPRTLDGHRIQTFVAHVLSWTNMSKPMLPTYISIYFCPNICHPLFALEFGFSNRVVHASLSYTSKLKGRIWWKLMETLNLESIPTFNGSRSWQGAGLRAVDIPSHVYYLLVWYSWMIYPRPQWQVNSGEWVIVHTPASATEMIHPKPQRLVIFSECDGWLDLLHQGDATQCEFWLKDGWLSVLW